MDTKTETKTQVVTEIENGKIIQVESPLFIIFAEFLGYVSIFNKIAEDWCNGKVPMTHIQKVVIVEAKCIFRQMKKDYSMDDIREFYKMYYPLILEEYDENLTKIIVAD